jgi:outer membrane protein
MNRLVKISGMMLVALLLSFGAQAQKFGYLNSAALMAELPKVKQADTDLEAFQKQLQKKGQDMVTAFQTKVAEFQKKVEAGEVPPKIQEETEKKLEEERQKILDYEQDMMKQLQDKREALLKPIMDEINTAIKAVAAENGYQYIFDQGVLLHFDSALDISAMVKKKLGV